MFEAQRIVRDRQTAIVKALLDRKIPFALIASNATYVWIESVDPSGVRQYRNIEFIIQRDRIDSVKAALENLYREYQQQENHVLFRTKHVLRDRWSDRAYFAGEQLSDAEVMIPSLSCIELVHDIPVVSLRDLVTFQLKRLKLDDAVDLRDMIEVGLIDASWPAKLPPELASRLQEILDNPEG